MNSPSFLTSSAFVALGGGFGAWLRFAVGRLIGPVGFPYATLSVNLIGSFAMGLFTAILMRQVYSGEVWRLLLCVGVLGGFTTFSAFSLDIVTLAQRGAFASALVYGVLSIAGSVIALLIGLWIAS